MIRRRPAFTLVELLVVMGIVAVLLAVTGPLVRGILSGHNLSDGVDATSGYLAYARTQAVTQNAYVVVGFCQVTGSDDLQIASVISTNGTFDPASFKPSSAAALATSYPALGRTVHVNNVTLIPAANISSQLQAKTPAVDGNAIADCSAWSAYTPPTNPGYFSFQISGKPYKYCFIAFSPQGEALFFPVGATSFAATLPFYSQLFIGLQATRNGSVVNGDVNSAAITVDGGSGDIKVYRL